MTRINLISDLHPQAYMQFRELAANLQDTPFRAFETLRSAHDQALAYLGGKSKARAWYSAHQYGLAVDFVPLIDGKWNWNVKKEEWDVLKERAHSVGLLNDIPWDRAHVEHPLFRKIRATW